MQLSTNMMTNKQKEEENPYEAYFSKYAEVRKGVEASGEEIDGALITAMGTPSQMVSESLRPLHNFVHRAISERGIPLNWIFQAEHDLQGEEQIRKRIMQLGEELSAKVTIHTEGGRGLGKDRSQRLRKGIGHMVAAGVVAELGSAAVDLREHHISTITAEVREDTKGVYTVAFTAEGEHPQRGLPLSIQGTAQIQIV